MHVSMNDSELLKKYEPVLRFAKSERFFPMAVEPYLEKCTIFPSGPQGVVGLLAHPNEPLATRIGNLESGEYFLRFVNDPLIDADVWKWWGISSILITVVGWFASVIRHFQSGYIYHYAFTMIIGILLLLTLMVLQMR